MDPIRPKITQNVSNCFLMLLIYYIVALKAR